MSEFLPKDVREGLEMARKQKLRKKSRLRVKAGEQTFTILRYWDKGFALDVDDAPNLRGLVDEAKTQLGSGIAVFVGVNEGKAAVSVGVTKDLTDKYSAVDLVRIASAAVGGKGGGGRPDMAQAGGPDGSNADAALDAVRAALAE